MALASIPLRNVIPILVPIQTNRFSASINHVSQLKKNVRPCQQPVLLHRLVAPTILAPILTANAILRMAVPSTSHSNVPMVYALPLLLMDSVNPVASPPFYAPLTLPSSVPTENVREIKSIVMSNNLALPPCHLDVPTSPAL